MPPHQPVPTIATPICLMDPSFECRLLSPDLEQTGSIASHYPFLLGRRKPRHAVDQADRIFLAHVEGIVGAEQHLGVAELFDQVAQLFLIELNLIEQNLIALPRRALFYPRTATHTHPPIPYHSSI